MEGAGSVGAYGSTQSLADYAAQMFKKVDANGDGSISLDEFQAGAPQGPPPGDAAHQVSGSGTQQPPSLKELFAKIDTDGDGKVTADEFKTFMKQMHGHHHHKKADSSDGATAVNGADNTTEAPQSSAPAGGAPITEDNFIQALAESAKKASEENAGYTAQGPGAPDASAFIDTQV